MRMIVYAFGDKAIFKLIIVFIIDSSIDLYQKNDCKSRKWKSRIRVNREKVSLE
jgi:hypothetical protein